MALRATSGWSVYESIKMRMVGHYVDGEVKQPHPDLQWHELAIGSVWWLLSAAERYAIDLIGPDLQLGMTLGVPRAYMRSDPERNLFLTVARAAWRLFRTEGALKRPTIAVEQLARSCKAAYAHFVELDAEQVKEWIRSEAEAAMWWAFRSPSVGTGPYAKVDVGAGTTNASVFRITGRHEDGRWVKDGLAFFGAHSDPCGMDDVCKALAGALQADAPSSFFDLRGQEEGLFTNSGLAQACGPAFDGIRRAFREAWRQMLFKNGGAVAEMEAWRGCAIAFLGGGGSVKALMDHVKIHPQNGDPLSRLPLEAPPDLRLAGERPPPEAVRFLLVAYGLSTIGLDIPEATGPDDIPPLPNLAVRTARLNHEDIYGNG
jgi:hypothetical protein